MSKHIESKLSRYLRKGVKFKEVGIVYILDYKGDWLINMFVPLNKKKTKLLICTLGIMHILTQKKEIIKDQRMFDSEELTIEEARNLLKTLMRSIKIKRICSKLEI